MEGAMDLLYEAAWQDLQNSISPASQLNTLQSSEAPTEPEGIESAGLAILGLGSFTTIALCATCLTMRFGDIASYFRFFRSPVNNDQGKTEPSYDNSRDTPAVRHQYEH